MLKEFISIYSPTGSTEEAVNFLVDWANNNGFEAHKDSVGNFVASIGSGEEILLVGHLDTVEGEIPIKLEGRKLFGRGSVDAKSSLVCFLEAAKKVTGKKVTVVGCMDEEKESHGAKFLLDKYNPSYIVIGEPSGWNGLTLGYRGRINIFYELFQDKEHHSTDTPNALENGIAFFNNVKKLCNEYNKEKSMFYSIGSKLVSINSHDDGFKENIKLKINVRLPIGLDVDEFKSKIEHLNKNGIIDYSTHELPVKTGKANKLVNAFIKQIDGIKFKVKSGTSDMNILQKYNVPIVAYGPGDSSLDHTPNEFIDLDEFDKSVEILGNVLNSL